MKKLAQVTVELRDLIEKTDFELFDFEYTFDDTTFKKTIEEQVIYYYYFSEIGQETPDRFKHVFRTTWWRIIGYYNELYNMTLLDYNPLVNYSMTEALEQLATSDNSESSTSKTNVTGESKQDNKTTSDGNTKSSDYPQQPIAGGDYLDGEATTKNTSNTNASNTSKDNSTSEGDVSSKGTTNTTYQKTVEGITGTSYQELIAKQRDSIIRIVPMIINDLKPCFILVY